MTALCCHGNNMIKVVNECDAIGHTVTSLYDVIKIKVTYINIVIGLYFYYVFKSMVVQMFKKFCIA